MQDLIERYLNTIKKKNILLLEMQQNLPGHIQYKEFADAISELEAKEILIPVKAKGTNGKVPGLYNQYRTNKTKLNADYIEQIQNLQFTLAPKMKLDAYLKLPKEVWERDYLYIQKLDEYIKLSGLPTLQATLPERSYEILGNEKWLEQEGGVELLERLGILDTFKLTQQADPLMLAVNPKAFTKTTYHLIVENKSTFYLFLKDLPNTFFTSLIYGCGWKIIAGIEGLYNQLGVCKEDSNIYYFGDLDYEGIAIYHGLGEQVKLAVPFYQALLKKAKSYGKESQRKNEEALGSFLKNFSDEEGSMIKTLLEEGAYIPQEALLQEEAHRLWRNLYDARS